MGDTAFNKLFGGGKEKKEQSLFYNVLTAAGTLIDAVEEGTMILLKDSGRAVSTVVRKRFGDEAGDMATELADIGNNLYLVYVDSRGLTP